MRTSAIPQHPQGDPNPYTAPATDVGATPVAATGGPLWLIFLSLAVPSGLGFWLIWSVLKSYFMEDRLLPFLAGPGAAGGWFFGIFFGAFMTLAMRPATVTLALADPRDAADRIDREMAKLGYRVRDHEEGLRTYRPKRLFRPRAFNVVVRVGPVEATAAGPKATLTALKKRLNP